MPKIEIAEGVQFMADASGAVLLNIQRDQMHVVNEIGALIWRKLIDGIDINNISSDIASLTGEDYSQISEDVVSFVKDLERRGVLIIT